MTTEIAPLDETRAEAFAGRVLEDFGAAMATVLTMIGDRVGLFAALAEGGPATSAELAARAGLDERYVREWLHGLASAGYVERVAGGDRFVLPPEHVGVLAQERGPAFMCGGYQELYGALATMPQLVAAFRDGGGVPQSAYPPDFWEGLTRFTAGWHENLLVQEWLPLAPGVRERLEAGARFADVGCGRGLAVVKLAEAFPRSTFVGYDAFEGVLDGAREAAEDAGVADRVRFEVHDAAGGLPERYDVISTFDVVHDAVDPAGLLRAIRDGLADDGRYLMLEINCADRPQDNTGPLATLLYGFSVTYCMTTSLAHGGAGLGTCGIGPGKAAELCGAAGFSHTERLPLESPFHSLYLARP